MSVDVCAGISAAAKKCSQTRKKYSFKTEECYMLSVVDIVGVVAHMNEFFKNLMMMMGLWAQF